MIPNRPQGTTNFHRWAQGVHDKTFGGLRPSESQGAFIDTTTKGSFSRPKSQPLRPQAAIFTVYQSGTWLEFKVTAGYVITTADPVIPANIETTITITSGVEFYWFYIDFSSTPTITASATRPTWDATKIPIAWVDTLTDVADSISTIHPYREFIYNPCAT